MLVPSQGSYQRCYGISPPSQGDRGERMEDGARYWFSSLMSLSGGGLGIDAR